MQQVYIAAGIFQALQHAVPKHVLSQNPFDFPIIQYCGVSGWTRTVAGTVPVIFYPYPATSRERSGLPGT